MPPWQRSVGCELTQQKRNDVHVYSAVVSFRVGDEIIMIRKEWLIVKYMERLKQKDNDVTIVPHLFFSK